MNKKHHVFIEDKKVTKKQIQEIEQRKSKSFNKQYENVKKINDEQLKKEIDLKHTHGRVIISIDMEAKNTHKFSDGTQIYVGKQFNNLNRRETHPVNAYVISAEGIPKGSEILIHPNATHDSNRIFSFGDDLSDIKYFSINENECYLWRDNSEWKPLKGFATGLRVYKEYKGPILGIENEQVKNVLYITSGEYEGQVVHTLKACDYEIIFMGKDGVEDRIIRCRHFENEINEREELICIDKELTASVKKGDLLIGINQNNAKSIIFTL
jgi:hypothetical protein